MRSLSLVEQFQLIWNFFFQLPWKWWLFFFLGIGLFLSLFSDRFFGKFRIRLFIGLFVSFGLLFCFRYRTTLLPLADFIGTQFVSFLAFPNLFLYGLVCLLFLVIFFRQIVLYPQRLRYRLWILLCSFFFFLCNCCLLFLIVRGDVVYHFPEFYTDEVLLSLLQMSLFFFCIWVVGYVILRVHDWFLRLPIATKKSGIVIESVVEGPVVRPVIPVRSEQTSEIESPMTGDLYRDLEPVLKDAHDFFGL